MDFDYELGNIPEEQYRSVRRGTSQERPDTAVRGVAGPAGAAASSPEEDAIEREVRQLRKSGVTCSRCGAKCDTQGKYCAKCGFEIGETRRLPDRKE